MIIFLFTEEPNQEAREGRETYSSDKSDIDELIKEVNKFCLLAKLQISSGIIYETSQLEDLQVLTKMMITK